MEGGCYCGAVRYRAEGEPLFHAECFCRECQYISGGMANAALGVARAGFAYVKGTPKQFRRADLDQGVVREFCGECGTPLATQPPGLPDVTILKVGSLDDPSVFQPQMAIYLCDRQPFHQTRDGVAAFERLPG